VQNVSCRSFFLSPWLALLARAKLNPEIKKIIAKDSGYDKSNVGHLLLATTGNAGRRRAPASAIPTAAAWP
jgi:hypothetical protein